MSITRTIKIAQGTFDKVCFKMTHRTEIQKFKDPRRVCYCQTISIVARTKG